MKITLLGNFDIDYSSETYYVKSLESLGHEVEWYQEKETTGEQIFESALGSDLFVWIHGHKWETPGKPMEEVIRELKDRGVMTITWHHDLWHGLAREKDLPHEDVYQNAAHFFSTDKTMADWFSGHTDVKGHYLPSALYDQEATMLTKQNKEPEVVFIGNYGYHPEWPYRPQLIDWLKQTYGDNFGWYSGEEQSLGLKRGFNMNQLFADTKVVVGDTLCPDFNYPYYWSDRVWETLGRGGFLIMPYVKGMDDYFEDGKHLVFYEFGDFNDLKSKIDFYLSNDEAREYIRRQGFELVSKNHTYRHRWEAILNEIKTN